MTYNCRYCELKTEGWFEMKAHMNRWHREDVKRDIQKFNKARAKKDIDPYTGELLEVIK